MSHKTEFQLQLTGRRTCICQAKTNLPSFALSARKKNLSISIERFQNFCDQADWNMKQTVPRRKEHLKRSLSISKIKRKHHKWHVCRWSGWQMAALNLKSCCVCSNYGFNLKNKISDPCRNKAALLQGWIWALPQNIWVEGRKTVWKMGHQTCEPTQTYCIGWFQNLLRHKHTCVHPSW